MTKLIAVFRDFAKALTNKERVNIKSLVKLENTASGFFIFLNEIIPWRRLQV
jgi:hypothetical protein